MEVKVQVVTRGVWKPFRFECPACHHVTVAKAFGAARASGAPALARWTAANAEAEADADAMRVAETATCPRCNHRDEAKLRRYLARRGRLMIVLVIGALVALGTVFLLPKGAAPAVALVVVLGLSLLGGHSPPPKDLPPLAERVVFPTEPGGQVSARLPRARDSAVFLCGTCRQPAALLTLREAVLELRGFVEDVDDPIASAELAAVEAGLEANDEQRLWSAEPQWVPFYCAECEVSYCREHWKREAAAHAGESDVEIVRVVCPSGHTHELA